MCPSLDLDLWSYRRFWVRQRWLRSWLVTVWTAWEDCMRKTSICKKKTKGFSAAGVTWRSCKFKSAFAGDTWETHKHLYCRCRLYWWAFLKSYTERSTHIFPLLTSVLSPVIYSPCSCESPSYVKDTTGITNFAIKAGFSFIK